MQTSLMQILTPLEMMDLELHLRVIYFVYK